MNVLFLTQGTTVPSSRFRVLQLVPAFEAAGVRCTVRPGYGDDYNAMRGRALASAWKLEQRVAQLVRSVDAGRFDAVVVQKPLLPFTAAPERILHRVARRTILDIDDAVWEGGGRLGSALRARAFAVSSSLHDHVICGNRYLEDRVARPAATTVIPTVIDTDRYVPPAGRYVPRDDGVVRIGWIGTAPNFVHLAPIAPAIRAALDARPGLRFRIVSNEAFGPLADHPSVEQVRWRADEEIAQLQSFDLGLMPLLDTPAARGKCAFKMIQYLAVGAPYVVSPVGANVEVHEHSQAGFVATSNDAWTRSILELSDDAAARAGYGVRGRQAAVDHFSIHAVLPAWLRALGAAHAHPASG